MSNTGELERVRALVEPIASDLDLDVYDVERRGATVRVTLDTRPGSDGGITLDTLSLATRLISREIDHEDPIPNRFTLEVTSPGLERHLRTPAHFQREVGKPITVRFRDPDTDPRRVDGLLVGADDTSATLRLDDDTETTFSIDAVDKARVVFEWGPAPKPGGPKKGQQKPGPEKGRQKPGRQNTTTPGGTSAPSSKPPTNKDREKQIS